MARIDIEYGSLASSETLNHNFRYLEESISAFAQVIETNKASLESQLSTVNKNVTEKLDSGLDELTENLSLMVPVGSIIPMFQTDREIPGFMICHGGTLSRTTHKALYDKIKTTYGEGDGSTTFNVPDFRNRSIWGASTGTDFGYLSAGLPNITGGFSATDGRANGAFSVTSRIGGLDGGGVGTYMYGFNANSGAKQWNSACAGIYGGSTTVQPPSVKVNFYIKY